MVRRLFRAVAPLLLLAACARGSDASAADSNAVTNTRGRVEVGLPAPAYTAVSLTGDSVSLQGLRGKVVLLNIWATWCAPCRTEIPELRQLHDTYRERGLELIGVSVDTDGTDDRIRKFMADFQMNFPVWRDADERISTKFLTVGVPATFLIDRNGILRWKRTGPIAPNDSTLSAAIERALGS